MGKTLERIIYNRLLQVVDRHFSFHGARLTIDAIKMVTDVAENAMYGGRSTSKYCAVFALDVQNTFNSTSWNLIKRSLAMIGVLSY